MSIMLENENNLNCNGTLKTSAQCRICLTQGNIPIHKNCNGDLASTICTIAGIQVSISDPYPKYLCTNCHIILQDAILFAKTAQNTDKILRKVSGNEKFGASNVKNINLSSLEVSKIQLECKSGINIDILANDKKEGKQNHCSDLKEFFVQNICTKCNRTLECTHCSTKALSPNPKGVIYVKRILDSDTNGCVLSKERNEKESIKKHFNKRKILKKSTIVTTRLFEKTKLNSDVQEIKFDKCNEYYNSIKEENLPQPDKHIDTESESDCIPLHCTENNIKVKTNAKVKEKLITCKYCNIEIKGGKEYLKHAQTAEHKEKRNYCSICDKSFSETYMRKHRRKHKNPEREHRMCDICGKKFTNQGNLRRHKATHTTNFPFKCLLCPYRGPAADYLKSHMLVHCREKPFICDECPQRFHRRCNLLAHKKKAHTNEDRHKFVCDCGKKYTSKQKLDMHYQSIHTGKQEMCKTCGKSFSYRTSLTRHELKVHKREKLNGRSNYLKIEKEMDCDKKFSCS